MKSSPRVALSIAEAMFEPVEGTERLRSLVDDVLAFVSAAPFGSRAALYLALWALRLAPLLLFVSWRPLDLLDRERRRDVLARVEGSWLGLALVGWRSLLILHLYEDAKELARIGYRAERRRHLAIVPAAAESGVRLRDDAVVDDVDADAVDAGDSREQGAA